MPDKPFFMYFSLGATHAPHHVPADWIEKYKGKFDGGWDKQREATFARQKELGVIPADAELTQRHAEIPAWDEMSEEMKPVLARQMEVYAAFMEHTDHHVGRLVDAIEDLGALEDTLVYVIVGDNGASAEGTVNGAFNEMANFNAMAELETPEFMASVLDKFGSPESYNHYSVGWAHAMNTPYQWTKQVASHWGGTRNGTIVRWPNGISARDEVRNQFSHLIDVTPTVLEVAGLPQPTMVNGIMQAPIEGTSMAYSFDAPDEPERHDLQYFEMFGNRGIYYKGWSAVTKHRTPWVMGSADVPAFDDDVWELYDGSQDWTQANDLAQQMPDRLHELQRLWLMEATKYNVLPLDDRTAERLNADIAGRPQLVRGNSQVLFGGMGRLSESSVLSIKNKSFTVTAEVVVGGWRGKRPDHRPGRALRRLGALRQGRQGGLRLQPARAPGVRDRGGEADPGGHASGPDGVRLRRRRAREGRRRDALLRRRPGGRGTRRSDPAVHLLGRRDDRRGLRRRHARLGRHADRAVHRDRSTGSSSTSATTPTTTSSIPTTSCASRCRCSNEEPVDQRAGVRGAGDVEHEGAVLAPQLEAQERAAAGLGRDELAGAPLDVRRVAQADAQARGGRCPVEQPVGGERVNRARAGRAARRKAGCKRWTFLYGSP